jgi:Flp pilus assembly protein CpaB
VDIVVNFSGGDEELKIKPFVATILQNIEVLAIGTEKIKDNPGKPDVNNLAKTITLAFSRRSRKNAVCIRLWAVQYCASEKGR